VWTVTVAVLLLTKLLRRRRVVCANFVIADSHLALEPQDLFTANQMLHLKPLIGEDVLDAFLAANPFVTRFYPNTASVATGGATASTEFCSGFSVPTPENGRHARHVRAWPRALSGFKTVMDVVLRVPAPFIE